MASEQRTLEAPGGATQAAVAPVDHKANYNAFVDRMTTQVIAAMPLTVPDADLKRSRAKFRVAFSADAQGALQQCTPESVARAIVMSAMSGLYPGGPRPDVYLIPRSNSKNGNQLEANWQISFRGYIRLARRAGWELEPVLVFEGEKFEILEGDRPSITHVRNLDLPKTFATLRYGYIRVFPEGKRESAKIGYLTKEEIVKRRGKAKDQSIWNEWPLEMAYKTLCHYAGNREMFPTDDPARYAMEASDQAEIGGGGESTPLPAGTKTERLAQRLAAAPSPGVVIDVKREAEAEESGDADAWDVGEQKADAVTEPLSGAQATEIAATAGRAGVSIDALEEFYGGRLDQVTVPGLSAAQLEAEILGEIRKRAKKK